MLPSGDGDPPGGSAATGRVEALDLNLLEPAGGRWAGTSSATDESTAPATGRRAVVAEGATATGAADDRAEGTTVRRGGATKGLHGRDPAATGQIRLGEGRIWPEEPAAAAMAEEVGRGRDWRRADGDEEAATGDCCC